MVKQIKDKNQRGKRLPYNIKEYLGDLKATHT